MGDNVSLKGVAQKQQRIDKKARTAADMAAKATGEHGFNAVASDSFVNFAQKMGVGADNPMSTASYGFNPVTRIRTVLEWIHRGSWLGGVAIDLVADDMTRAGVEITGEMKPENMQKVHTGAVRCRIWESINAAYKWSRLYGGGLAVMMIEGQDLSTPLRVESIGKGQFKGLMVLDRWMVEPSMGSVIDEAGPDMGLPKFYHVRNDAPGMRAGKIHHSRCLRLVGVELPYWQAVMEQMWGISVLERLWDRMTAFDSGTTGIAQLIYKAYIRTYKIKGLRNIVAAGGKPLQGLLAQVDLMRRTQSAEGVTLMDMDDEFEAMQTVPFAGLADALLQLGQQLSGALQIPLVRLFGQSPAGLNATGESDLRMYYDNINKEQNKSIVAITTIYRVMARSEGVEVGDDFGIKFKSLWQLTDKEKAEIAEITARAVAAAEEAGLVSQKTAMKELKQSSHVTGIFTNITDEEINAAEESLPPAGEEAANQELEAAKELASHGAGETRKTEETKAKLAPKPKIGDASHTLRNYPDLWRPLVGKMSPRPTQQQAEEWARTGKWPTPELAAAWEVVRPKPRAGDTAISSVSAMKQYHDLDVIIENEKGSVRRGKGPGGVPWEAILAADYGACRRTQGADGEPFDCFVGPVPASGTVWLIHQIDPSTKEFDEHKAMLGFPSRKDALATYRASYSDDATKRIGWVYEMEMDDFKALLGQYTAPGIAPAPRAEPLPIIANDAVVAREESRSMLRTMQDTFSRTVAAMRDMVSRQPQVIQIGQPSVAVHLPEQHNHIKAGDVKVDVAAAPAPSVTVQPAAVHVAVKAYPASSTEHIARDADKEITTITRKNED